MFCSKKDPSAQYGTRSPNRLTLWVAWLGTRPHLFPSIVWAPAQHNNNVHDYTIHCLRHVTLCAVCSAPPLLCIQNLKVMSFRLYVSWSPFSHRKQIQGLALSVWLRVSLAHGTLGEVDRGSAPPFPGQFFSRDLRTCPAPSTEVDHGTYYTRVSVLSPSTQSWCLLDQSRAG